jgi:hypothetical protein
MPLRQGLHVVTSVADASSSKAEYCTGRERCCPAGRRVHRPGSSCAHSLTISQIIRPLIVSRARHCCYRWGAGCERPAGRRGGVAD